ncbi:MAG: nonstructural protein [Microvirus sp.]|nr:MAG: nonstructural protein [Microvirus sp.]
MILHAVSVYDRVTETYARPFFVAHPGSAVRSFHDECNNPESEVSKHTADYDLFFMFTFDDATGEVDATHARRLLRGSDIQKA